MGKVFGILRTVGLWILILFSAGAIAVCYLKGNWIWGHILSGIAVWIVGWEVWGLTIGFPDENGVWTKRTISTEWKKWTIRVGWWGYLALFFFVGAMALGLAPHLAFWGLIVF